MMRSRSAAVAEALRDASVSSSMRLAEAAALACASCSSLATLLSSAEHLSVDASSFAVTSMTVVLTVILASSESNLSHTSAHLRSGAVLGVPDTESKAA